MIQIVKADGAAEKAVMAAMKARAAQANQAIDAAAAEIMETVREKGFEAGREYSLRFDKAEPREITGEELQAAYGEDLVLLAVSSGEDEETVKSFVEKNGYTFRVGLDPDYAVFMLYPSEYIPYTVVIGTDGKVAVTHTGADDYAYYSELVEGLLAA